MGMRRRLGGVGWELETPLAGVTVVEAHAMFVWSGS